MDKYWESENVYKISYKNVYKICKNVYKILQKKC